MIHTLCYSKPPKSRHTKRSMNIEMDERMNVS